MKPTEIAGIFLSFKEQELSEIKRRLDLFGYKPDGEGLKELIVDTLCNMEQEKDDNFISPTDRLINSATDYIGKNPEKIALGIAAIKGLTRMLRKKKP